MPLASNEKTNRQTTCPEWKTKQNHKIGRQKLIYIEKKIIEIKKQARQKRNLGLYDVCIGGDNEVKDKKLVITAMICLVAKTNKAAEL